MLEHRFEELKLTGNLPSPAGVGLAILRITQGEDASLDDVVAVLQTDPTLTGRILKLANSGEKSCAHPATNARAAAMRLGLRNVRNISLGFSLLSGNRTGRCRAFDYDDFWSHSLAVAVAAQAIAERRGAIAPSDAFTCGLLSGMGRLALASIHPGEYEGVLARARGQSSARLAEIEQESFGTHHREMTAALLQDWALPVFFVDAVGLVGSGASPEELRDPLSRQLAYTLQAARDLARALTVKLDAGAEELGRVVGELDGMAEREKLDAPGLADLWKSVSAGWRTWGDSMHIRASSQLVLEEIRRRASSALPVVPAQVASAAASNLEPAPASSAGLRVLLVGLGSAVHAALSDVLGRDGHAVATADDGHTALMHALEQAPHVLVSAWDVRGLDGLELVRTLRKSELGGSIHAILVAGRTREARLLEAFECGVDEYVFEPVDPRLITARIRAAQRMVALSGRIQELLREREAQVSQLAILTRKLEITAMTDALTGLFNRRYALERLGREVASARTASQTLSVIMIDIDRFKSVNDAHGHDVGDVVLRETAQVLRGALRKGDTLARLGGEEFLVICPSADLEVAGRIAERLRVAVRGHVVQRGTFQRAVTLSLGVAELDPAQPDVDAFVKRADENVYLAKDGGRDRVVTGRSTSAARIPA